MVDQVILEDYDCGPSAPRYMSYPNISRLLFKS